MSVRRQGGASGPGRRHRAGAGRRREAPGASRARSAAAGFTLLELIVAAGILALIAVFSWRGLDALIREREAIAASQAAIDVLQRSFARIERDALSAADVELADGGELRFVAGATSVDGAPAASGTYRLVDGALTRSVEGVDRAPLIMLDHVASLAMEAWQPSPRGGAWVRTKDVAVETPLATPAGAQAGATQPAANGSSTAAQVPPGTSQPNGAAPANTAQPAAVPVASISPATGVRFTFARADGLQVVRSFMIGGG